MSPAMFCSLSTVRLVSVSSGQRQDIPRTSIPNRTLLQEQLHQLVVLHVRSGMQRRDPLFLVLVPEGRADLNSLRYGLCTLVIEDAADEMFAQLGEDGDASRFL